MVEVAERERAGSVVIAGLHLVHEVAEGIEGGQGRESVEVDLSDSIDRGMREKLGEQ